MEPAFFCPDKKRHAHTNMHCKNMIQVSKCSLRFVVSQTIFHNGITYFLPSFFFHFDTVAKISHFLRRGLLNSKYFSKSSSFVELSIFIVQKSLIYEKVRIFYGEDDPIKIKLFA